MVIERFCALGPRKFVGQTVGRYPQGIAEGTFWRKSPARKMDKPCGDSETPLTEPAPAEKTAIRACVFLPLPQKFYGTWTRDRGA